MSISIAASPISQERFYDQAIADFTKVIALKPDDANVYNQRAWNYHLKGEDAKGLSDANKAIALAPNDTANIETRAEIYERSFANATMLSPTTARR